MLGSVPRFHRFCWGFYLLLIQALALFLCRASIKMLMFPGSSIKITCLFWPTSPPAISFLARLPSLLVVNTVLSSFLNKLLQQFPLSSHPISKLLLMEHSSQAPPGSSCFLLFPAHLHTSSVSATDSMPLSLWWNLYSWHVLKEKCYLFQVTAWLLPTWGKLRAEEENLSLKLYTGLLSWGNHRIEGVLALECLGPMKPQVWEEANQNM